jgi:hypothetical protein
VQADAIRAGAPNAPNASEFVALLTPIAQAFASGRTVYPVRPSARNRARARALCVRSCARARALSHARARALPRARALSHARG